MLLGAVIGSAWADEELERWTLNEVVRHGLEAFQVGDLSRAAETFDYLDSQFESEPEYDQLGDRFLPLWGYACLHSGRWDEAVDHFEKYLASSNLTESQRSTIVYLLARAHQRSANWDAAEQHYRELVASNGSWFVKVTVHLAEVKARRGDVVGAVNDLVAFADAGSDLQNFSTEALLRAMALSYEAQEFDLLADVLLAQDWSEKWKLESPLFNVLAVRVGNRFFDEGDYDRAIRLLRLAVPYRQLANYQHQHLARMNHELEERSNSSLVGLLQRADLRMQHKERQNALARLEEMGDYSPGVQFRIGQAYMFGNRFREAVIWFRHLARDTQLPLENRALAQFHWMAALAEMEEWDEAISVGQSLLDLYPNNQKLPQVRYLLAQVYQSHGEFGLADEALSELIKRFPGHAERPRWVYARALNASLGEDYRNARIWFQEVIDSFPESGLLTLAHVGYAMTYYYERNNQRALEFIEKTLGKTKASDPGFPELVYRRAQILYADQQNAVALSELNAFLTQFDDHLRADEARVLTGDILLGQGQLPEALNAFLAVPPASGPLYTYATFQIGKAYRALSDYDGLRDHFTHYIKTHRREPPRLVEAFYWILWANHQQDGGKFNAGDSLLLGDYVCGAHGNDPDAEHISLILSILEESHSTFHRLNLQNVAQPSDPGSLPGNPVFMDWLVGMREQALANQRWTWLSRIDLYRSEQLIQRGKTAEAMEVADGLVNIVPIEAFDARGLAQLGMYLVEQNDPAGQRFFARLIEWYPESIYAGSAYYGFALVAHQDGDVDQAHQWIDKLNDEFPQHRRLPEAWKLLAELLLEAGEFDRSIEVYQRILNSNLSRGQSRSQALLGLGLAYRASGDYRKAIPFFQRVFLFYRAFPDEVVAAYIGSARCFEAIGDIDSAHSTWTEFVEGEELAAFVDEQALASAELERLNALLAEQPIRSELNINHAIESNLEVAQ
ncbi:MAG: tetratricopeptide repeat protein [Verrucomicrobiota bacterium]